MIKKSLLILGLTLAVTHANIEWVPFHASLNFCDRHNCAALPVRKPPKTVIITHGAQGGIERGYYPNYKNLAQFMKQLSNYDPEFKVLLVDYNANGARTDAPFLKILSLKEDYNGQDQVWDEKTMVTSSVAFEPYDIKIRKVADTIRTELIKMAQSGQLKSPVTLIGYSMGGLIMRDLLYQSDVRLGDDYITGYEELYQAGLVINEYISLGTPHEHAMLAPGLYEFAYQACENFNLSSPILYQFCMLTSWINSQKAAEHQWRNGRSIEISRVDFPQIHWVAAAGLGVPLLDGSPGDGCVSAQSALRLTDNEPQHVHFNRYVALGEYTRYRFFQGLLVYPGKGQSGFDRGIDSSHNNLPNVAFFPNATLCAAGSKAREYGEFCYGYFQYIVPHTTLSLLPGFDPKNAYYQANPQFSPQYWPSSV